MFTGDAAPNQSAQTLTGVLIDDRHDLDRPSIEADQRVCLRKVFEAGLFTNACDRRGASAFRLFGFERARFQHTSGNMSHVRYVSCSVLCRVNAKKE